MQKDCRSNPCHRHGSALNVHLHVLALDAAYTFEGECARFHRAAPPAAQQLERLCRDVARPAIALQRLSRDGNALFLRLDSPPVCATPSSQRQRASIRFAPPESARSSR